MEKLIKVIVKLFTLIEGRISENMCKVFCVANIAGLVFSMACLEGPYTVRAVFCGVVCMLLTCFFGSMVMMYEEVNAIEEESL